jgi:hypothetical protein
MPATSTATTIESSPPTTVASTTTIEEVVPSTSELLEPVESSAPSTLPASSVPVPSASTVPATTSPPPTTSPPSLPPSFAMSFEGEPCADPIDSTEWASCRTAHDTERMRSALTLALWVLIVLATAGLVLVATSGTG